MTGKEYCRLYRKSRDKAYDALFESYCNYVYAIAYNKLRSVASKEDIEECVSDVFSSVFLSYDAKGSFNGDLKGVIGKIASNKAINMFHSLSAKNGGSLSYSLEFFEELEDLRIRGSGWTPSGKGILSPCYIVSDPEIKRKIIDFLLIHRAVLLHAENAGIIRQFAAKHKEDLARLGDGDPYVGLERAGVAEWIKAGKDPEAEWRKKFPAGGEAEQ